MLREGESVDQETGEAKFWRAYAATVRVTVPGSQQRTDTGFQAVTEETVEGHETAHKGAVTDALKRALRSYGGQFGNSLYSDGATGDLAPSLRKTLVDLGQCRGFDEAKVRSAVRERTGHDLDELPVATLTTLVEAAARSSSRTTRARSPAPKRRPGPPERPAGQRTKGCADRRCLNRKQCRDAPARERRRGRPSGRPRRRFEPGAVRPHRHGDNHHQREI